MSRWIECARCLEAGEGQSDVVGWAEGHQALHPHHTRFRTVSQAYWRLAPRDAP